MIKKNKEIIDILEKISSLLSHNNELYWTKVFTFFKESFPEDPKSIAVQILSVYGGMGSFNDLVLCENMTPLKTENETLEKLREELYIKIKELPMD